ncbi:hypothetical protein CQW23_32594 [Capsicum baccatum]|uniref:Uncharacterized protein n=1 Tax=Capsicum baccatum TaxID=33114 RepID=A0A2G2V489_CAPBA|nr:hypothetical protein CQW23_32594 [Capsicum baccatum]
MSTTGRGWHSVLQIFKGRRERTGHHATCGALPAAGPYLQLSRFQGGQVCSHSNPSQKIKVGRRCTPRGDPTNQLRCALRVYSPVDSHTCHTPWSVFEDESNGEPTGQRPERTDVEARQRGLGPGPSLTTALQTIIRTMEPPDSKAGLFPIHSPLLRESLGLGVQDARRAVATMAKRVELQPLLAAMSVDVESHLGQKRARGAREALVRGFDNDPSAGSPTETLLRLVLPLNDKVQWTSRDVAGSEPPTSPRSEHFTGSFNR